MCIWYSFSARVCRALDLSTPGLISFSSIPDCAIILFSECSVFLRILSDMILNEIILDFVERFDLTVLEKVPTLQT